MIPTFLGSTILVFTILQMAPGGPIEQMMLELQMGGSDVGEGGGGASSSAIGGVSLPPKALKELERFYGFDKPIYQRYLSWLGVWPREIKHRDFSIPKDIKVTVEKQTVIKISGVDKELVSKIAADIKNLKPVEPYKGKGIKERGQFVLRKEGKKK